MKIYFCNIIDEESKTKTSKYLNIIIFALIIINISSIVAESFKELSIPYHHIFRTIEVYSVIIFTFEYFIRLFAFLEKEKASLKSIKSFILKPSSMIDLIAILPFYIPFVVKVDLRFLRILRITRVLRIFKLQRYTKAMNLLTRVLKNKKEELGITLFVTILMVLLSSTIMYYVENEAQPENFPNIISSMWWAIATLTTIGYGDICPITALGKTMGSFIAILGIGLIALPTGIISSGFIEELNKTKKHVCPHCGKEIS